ncbi:hypothetical protein QTP88_015362 [Uroleucon formosanum]
MELVKSNKYKDLLLYGGFLHREDKKQNNTIYWCCVESLLKCRIVTINGEIKSQPKEKSHNHVPDPCKIHSKMAVNNIKEAAVHIQNTHHVFPTKNNAVKGWHRGLTSVIGGSYPKIWKFIYGIKKIQNLEELKHDQYNAGQ